jgi:hypothetical protein
MLLEKYQKIVIDGDFENYYKIISFEEDDKVSVKNIETDEVCIVDRDKVVSAEIESDLGLYGNNESVFADRLCIALNFMSYEKGKKKVNKLLKKTFKDTIYFIDIDRFIVITKDMKYYMGDILDKNLEVIKSISDYVQIKNLKDPVSYLIEQRKRMIEYDNMDTITVGELNSERYKINGIKGILKILSFGIKHSFRTYYIHEYFKYLKLKECAKR